MKEQFIHIDKYGNKLYYSDRNMTILHREDGPAVEGINGHKEWRRNGKLNNENGPSIEWVSGFKSWHLNGEELTGEEFDARMNPVELTLDEIAEKFNVSVDKLKIKK